MSELKSQIQEDMKTAMRAKDKLRLGTVRMLLAAIKQREIDEKIVLDDAQIINTINKMIKQGRDSQTQFEQADRQELAQKEKEEIEVLINYLPEQLSAEQTEKIVQDTVSSVDATSMRDMGKVMGQLKSKLEGRTDMRIVSELVKKILSSS